METHKINFYPTRGVQTEEKRIWSLLGMNNPIKPATEFVPEWWNNLPKQYQKHDEPPKPTCKRCPGIFDFMRAGYILPMWSDLVFRWNGSNSEDGWDLLSPEIINQLPDAINMHDPEQGEGAPFLQDGCKALVKLQSPWYIDVPKGTSLLLTQPFYHINSDFTVVPGILDADLERLPNRELNVFIKLNKPDVPIKIEKGQPLMQIIPFVRADYEFSANLPDKETDLYNDLLNVAHRSTIVEATEAKKLQNNRIPKNYNV